MNDLIKCYTCCIWKDDCVLVDYLGEPTPMCLACRNYTELKPIKEVKQ